MKAIRNSKIIAQSNETVHVENNPYFPPASVHKEEEYLRASANHLSLEKGSGLL